MKTLEMLDIFGHWFWEFATEAQIREIYDHLDEVALYTAYREQQEEIDACEAQANPV